jgi:hypothetical protein
MTARELMDHIETNGGTLALLPDGRLQWQHVAPDLLAQLQSLKAEIVAILQDREKPRRWPSLFTPEELEECRRAALAQQNAERQKKFAELQIARERAERAAAQAAAPAEKRFVYVPRDPAMLERRIQEGAKKPNRRYGSRYRRSS